ncbi:hypothetical protein BC835DRAFT_1353585 [Cytidiella melzeri]|nr:hypothetical protein BC835DRAFT_1353585 [Cytidiella melzeri]
MMLIEPGSVESLDSKKLGFIAISAAIMSLCWYSTCSLTQPSQQCCSMILAAKLPSSAWFTLCRIIGALVGVFQSYCRKRSRRGRLLRCTVKSVWSDAKLLVKLMSGFKLLLAPSVTLLLAAWLEVGTVRSSWMLMTWSEGDSAVS